MVKFYVYTSAKDEVEFIEAEAIANFAVHEFDPETMLFSGIAIEANDFESAMQVYQHPACGFGELMLIDEPVDTATKRNIKETHNSVKARIEYLRAYLKLQMATMKMHEANTLLNDASNILFNMNGTPSNIPANVIFKQLSDTAVKVSIKYNGDSKKLG